ITPAVPPSTAHHQALPDNCHPTSPLALPATPPAVATTAPTCAVAHHSRSSTPTARTRHHDQQPHGPPVTSTPGPEALDGASDTFMHAGRAPEMPVMLVRCRPCGRPRDRGVRPGVATRTYGSRGGKW